MVAGGIGIVFALLLGVLALLPLVLAAFAIYSIFTGSRPMEHKLLWTVVVILAPFLGPILYFAFGRKSVQA